MWLDFDERQQEIDFFFTGKKNPVLFFLLEEALFWIMDSYFGWKQ